MKAKTALQTVAGACGLAALALLAHLVARAATPSLMTGALVGVTNTTSASALVGVGSFGLPRGQFVFSNGGLSNTNELTNAVQLTLDGSNFVTVATYVPSGTNATNEAWSIPFGAATVSMRVLTQTTGAVSVATLYNGQQ